MSDRLRLDIDVKTAGEIGLFEFLKSKGFEAALAAAPAEQPHPAQMALERDRTKVAECITAVKDALHNYSWLIEGRGSYEWDDDRWHDEFRKVCDNIAEAIGPMIRIAADWSNCPQKWRDVQAARAEQPLAKPLD